MPEVSAIDARNYSPYAWQGSTPIPDGGRPLSISSMPTSGTGLGCGLPGTDAHRGTRGIFLNGDYFSCASMQRFDRKDLQEALPIRKTPAFLADWPLLYNPNFE